MLGEVTCALPASKLSQGHALGKGNTLLPRDLIDSFACLPLTLPTVISYDLYMQG